MVCVCRRHVYHHRLCRATARKPKQILVGASSSRTTRDRGHTAGHVVLLLPRQKRTVTHMFAQLPPEKPPFLGGAGLSPSRLPLGFGIGKAMPSCLRALLCCGCGVGSLAKPPALLWPALMLLLNSGHQRALSAVASPHSEVKRVQHLGQGSVRLPATTPAVTHRAPGGGGDCYVIAWVA